MKRQVLTFGSIALFSSAVCAAPTGGDVFALPLEVVDYPEFNTPDGIRKYALSYSKDEHRSEDKSSHNGRERVDPIGSYYPIGIENLRYGQYRIKVQLGTPGKEFQLSVDTGAGNMWVPSVDCSSWSCVTAQRKYNHSESASYVSSGNETISIHSGSGGVYGGYAKDVLNIGDLSIADQGFVEGESVNVPFISTYDGVLGLGRKELAKGDQLPPFYRIVEAGYLRQSQFGIYLPKDVSKVNEGEIMFGGSNNYRITTPTNVTWLPVTGEQFWEVPLKSLGVAGYLEVVVGAYVGAILDTASPAILFPREVYEEISKVIREAVELDDISGIISCDLKETAPAITFSLNGVWFTVPASEYIFRGPPGCMLGLGALGDAPELANKVVLGSPFLRTYYSIYDIQRNEVGLAEAV